MDWMRQYASSLSSYGHVDRPVPFIRACSFYTPKVILAMVLSLVVTVDVSYYLYKIFKNPLYVGSDVQTEKMCDIYTNTSILFCNIIVLISPLLLHEL